MPSMTELIDLRDRAIAARRHAKAAEENEQAAVKAVAAGKLAYDAAVQRAAAAHERLDRIKDAAAQYAVAQVELQALKQSLTDIKNQHAELDVKIAALEAEIEQYRRTGRGVVPRQLLTALKQLRSAQKALKQRQADAEAAQATAQDRLAQLQAEAKQFDKDQKAVDEAENEVTRLQQELAQLERTLKAAQAEAAATRAAAQALAAEFQLALDQLIAGLNPAVPIALLPVRLETRFRVPGSGKPGELLIRIYPDDIHQDTHELGVTDDEETWGKHFWNETWRAGLAAPDDRTFPERRKQELAAWQQLAARFGSPRAAYIARLLTPLNEKSRPNSINTNPETPLATEPKFEPKVAKRPSSWSRAAQARALPDRWLAIGYRSGQPSNSVWGELIPALLPTGLDPSKQPSHADRAVSMPVDPGMLWMVDFKEAEVKGMGIRMNLTADEAASGFDRLIVFGVKGTLSQPEEGATELRELIEAHRFTWGCGFVPQGTPTNNTETVSSGYSREDVGFQTSFALEREARQQPRVEANDGSDGARAALALGLDVTDLTCLRYADGHDQRDAANFNRALWPATIGYFLDQAFNDILSGYNKDKWRTYFVDLVRARGPLPALRLGKQPYGVLPVTSLDLWQSGRMEMVRLLISLRNIWRDTLTNGKIAFAGRDSTEVGRDLVETLGLEAVSSTYSWRWARGPEFFDTFWKLPGQPVDPRDLARAERSLETQLQAVLQKLGLSGNVGPTGTWLTRLTKMTFARIAFDLNGPLVGAGEVSETQQLRPNYIGALADPKLLSLDNIHDESPDLFPIDQPKPLLYRLLRHATLLAYAEQVLLPTPAPPNPPLSPPWFEPELVDMDLNSNFDQPGDPFKTPTFWRVLKTVLSGSGGSVGDELRKFGLKAPDPLGGFLASLKQLADLPTASLERLLGETIDLASHRLDAWITSLATYRLNQFRAANPAGIYLGGYGWVENLHPRNSSSSDGFVHAPSIAQATTAAVLRSGYLAHKTQPVGARLEIDLSSRRVRLAQGLIDGVRQGQPLGALLGYSFERALHDATPHLNRMIASLRELAPLTGDQQIKKEPAEPLEAVAANNVVDGLKLLDLKKKTPDLFDKFSLTTAERATMDAAMKDIEDAVDAIGDLAIAEGVHQAVQGNYLRAGATLDAISRGETPGEIEVTKTPQSGVAFTQRLIALFNVTLPPNTSWSRNRARAVAEPVLNAWAEQLLGDPNGVRCKVQYFKPGKDPLKDAPDHTSDIDLAKLNLCALDIIYAPPITNEAQQTELELRLARAATIKSRSPKASVRLVFARDASYKNGELTFPELFEMARAARELFTNGRALDARDLARAGTGDDPRTNASRLAQQLADAMKIWQQATQTLTALFDVDQKTDLDKLKKTPFNVPKELLDKMDKKLNLLDLVRTPKLLNKIDLAEVSSALDMPDLSQLENLRDALEAFSAFAVQGGVPRSISDDTAEARKDLIAQAQSVYSQVKDVNGRLIMAPIGTVLNLSDTLTNLAVLFGEGFRVLLPFTLSSPNEFQPAMQRRKRALDAEPARTIQWLQTVARVRDGARRLATVLTYAEVVGSGDGMSFHVAQIPFSEKDHWNLPDEPASGGATSIVLHTRDNTLDFTQPFAGLMLDEWVEVIPSQTIQTALTFHYDAPQACAPQAILLAISPDPAKQWDASTIEAILNETLELAKLRTVDYDALSQVGHFLPALLLANNAGGDLKGDTVSSEFTQK